MEAKRPERPRVKCDWCRLPHHLSRYAVKGSHRLVVCHACVDDARSEGFRIEYPSGTSQKTAPRTDTD